MWSNNNNGNQTQNQSNGAMQTDKPKNPKLLIRGCQDGQIEMTVFKYNNSIYTGIVIKQMIGKDPNGRMTFENGLFKDMVNIQLRVDKMIPLILALEDYKPETINFTWAPWEGNTDNTITFVGSENDVKITIKHKNGTRSASLPTTPVGAKSYNGKYQEFIQDLKWCLARMLFGKYDDIASEDEVPFS